MKKIGILVGSLHSNSINRKTAEAFIKIGHPNLDFSFISISDLPLFSEDLEKNVPSSVLRFRQEIEQSDIILIMTPEYNRSITGVLKNALDWASRPYQEGVFINKKVAIAGIAPSPVGTAAAQVHLRSIIPAIQGIMIPQPEMCLTWTPDFFNANGLPKNEKTHQFFKKFLEALSNA
ncbi:MAG: NAD(P)H-dependent oxidoreductase [Alphaproteobacteria bacterium]|nr:NAD(P)H-dependent oxidoreductase [Alphaproteobacteria bacterium]